MYCHLNCVHTRTKNPIEWRPYTCCYSFEHLAYSFNGCAWRIFQLLPNKKISQKKRTNKQQNTRNTQLLIGLSRRPNSFGVLISNHTKAVVWYESFLFIELLLTMQLKLIKLDNTKWIWVMNGSKVWVMAKFNHALNYVILIENLNQSTRFHLNHISRCR